MRYKNTVNMLLNIQWQKITTQKELTELMFLSLVTAIEFSQSLRIAVDINPENENLHKMSLGELQTNNLVFSDYNYGGDHWEFLQHFLIKAGVLKSGWIKEEELVGIPKHVFDSALIYDGNIVSEMTREDRAMSIFSREEELSKIFSNILEKIPVFKEENLPEHLKAFKYYLEKHVALDSEPGGHHDLVKDLEITDRVNKFYALRVNLYHNAFPNLGVIHS